MHFLNPIGLLGLLALPAILFFHFFRSQRRQVRVGGLHLWDFARRELPAGRVWRRAFLTLPLLLELLAAAVLSLWLAGMTWRLKPERLHALVVLDDSASMGAVDGQGRSAAQKAVAWVLSRRGQDIRWTLVSSGLESRVLAGPFATSEQIQERLDDWAPSSPAAALSDAARFALKFGEPNQPVIVLTDSSAQEEELADIAQTQSFGEAAPNWTIVFADRFRSSPTTDRVFALVRRQGGQVGDKTELVLQAGGTEALRREAQVDPGQTKRFEFELPTLESTAVLSLGEDALAIDNAATLAPTPPRRVVAALALRPQLEEYARRAIEALPETYFSENMDEARLVLTDRLDFEPPARALMVLQFAPPTPDEDLALASEGFFPDRRSQITAGLTFEGLLWMFDSQAKVGPDDQVRLRAGEAPLLIQKPRRGRADVFFVNALPEYGNLARATVWPLLIHNASEMTRERMPGLRRTNFRVGEDVDTGLAELGPEAAGAFWTLKGPDGERVFDRAPSSLSGLKPGLYELYSERSGGEKTGFRFAVNFFAAEEGDLTALDSSSRANFSQAASPGRAGEGRHPLAHYIPLFLLCAIFAGLWALQERGSA